MGEFRLAGAYVEARMDRTKLDADIAKLKQQNITIKARVDLDTRQADERIVRLVRDRRIKVGVDLDDKAVSRSLQTLTRDRRIRLDLDLNQGGTSAVLTTLTQNRTVRVLVDLDDTAARARLDDLCRPRTIRVTADADTRAAADDLALLTRPRTTTITADADTAAAAARLALLTRDRRVNIRTNMLGLGSLGSLGSSLGSAGASAGMMGSRFVMLASAALMALPAVAALGQAIVQMGPAAAVAVPALGSLITMGAALGVGLHGVGTAFKSAFETGASSATSAASATRALESAQINVARSARALKEAQVDASRQIADAQKRVKQAAQEVRDTEVRAAAERRAALRRVADAERDLADAQKAATRAQEDLNEARKTAADQLEDLGNRLKDAELSQRDAVMDVADAEKELNALKAKGAAANADDLARAQLNYDKAVQRLSEQRIETQRLQEDNAEAAKKGVEGSDTVKAAQDRVADAQRNVGDKARGVGDAQAEAAAVAKSGAESVRAAQQALADAQQGVADAQTAASRQVRGAQEALADANRAVAAAMAQGSTEATKFNDAMSKLSPNARSFVEAVKGIAPAWSAVRVDVQDALFRGLGTTLTRMSTAVLPAVRDGLVGMAGVLNRMGTGLMDTFTKLGNQGLLKRMFDGFTEGMKPLEKVPGQLAQGFVQLSIAAAPAFKRLTTAAGNAMSGITDELTQAFKSGALEKAINNAIEIAKQFGHLLGDIFGTVGNIMKAASAGAGDALGGIGAMFKELRRITAMPEVQQMLTTIFRAVNDIAKLIAGTLGAVIMAVLPLLAALAPTVSALANALGPVLADLAEALGKALMPIIKALLPIVGVVGKALMDVATAIMPLLGPIGALIAAVVAALAPVLGVVLDVIVQLVSSLAGPLITVINALIPIVGIFGQFIGQLAPLMLPLLPIVLQLLPPLAQLAVSLLNLAMQVITPLMPLIITLAGLLAGVLAGALNILVPVLTTVIGWITKFVDMVTAGVKWVVAGFQWLYDTLVGHSIIPDLVKAIIKWFTDLWDNAKKIFNLIKDSIIGAWNATWKNVRQVWDTVWGGIKGSFTGAWKWIRDSVSLLKTAVTTAWSSMWTGARDKAMSIFTTIRTKISDFKNGVTSAFTSLRDGIGKIWSGIQSKLSGPIKWVLSNVYNDGIRKMWNTIAGKISSKIMLPAIGLKFARGGVVPGTGTGDTVPAMLTPNERVLSLAQVAKLGGHRAIDAMLGKDRSQGRTGGNPDNRVAQGMQHFDKGGIIGTISDLGGAAMGAVKGGFDWAKDLVIGGLKSAAQKAISSIVRPLINMIPDGGTQFGKLAKGIPNSALDQMLAWLGKEDKKAVGGPGVQHGLAWAKTQAGKAYQWGGNGNPSWDCATLSCVITTPRGPRKLADIDAGDTVTAFQDGKLVSSRVLAKWCTGEQEVYKVRTRNRELRVTAGHRVLAAVHQSAVPGAAPTIYDAWTTEWKHVRDLTRDDFLVTYTGHDAGDGENYPEDLAWLLGLWVADGSVQPTGGLRFCVYGDLAEKVQQVWRKYYPDRKSTHHQRHGVLINHKGFTDWMIENGFRGKSHERTVPPVVGTWNRAAQDAFLEGYADGDGCYRGSGRKEVGDFHAAKEIVYTATSRDLLEGIRDMHIQRGDRATVLREHNRGSKPIVIGGAEVLNVRPIYRFEAAPGRGASQSTGAGHRPGLLRLVEQLKAENMSVQKVLSVEPDGIEETWDIEVEDSHSFVSDGLVSHNCSGFVSAIESVIRGESPHRRWATGAFSGANAPGGWVRNLVSPYMIGITNAGVGHTAGTIAGVNVESRGGGGGVIVGSRARGANNSMWTDRYGFQPATKYDTGGLLQPGRTIVDNHTGKPEAVLSPEDRVKFEAIVQGGGAVTIQNLNINGTFDFSSPTARKQAADAMVAEMNEALRVWNRSRAR